MVGEQQLVDDLCDTLIRQTVPRIVDIVGTSPWTAWLPFKHSERFDDAEMLELLQIGRRLPPHGAISGVYGGWDNVVRVAGYADVPPPSSRGTRSTANDGHACFSQGERLMDDWFDANGVEHSREPAYPGSRYRGDFLVADHIVEYFGLAGTPDYESRMAEKSLAASTAGLNVVGVLPADLSDRNWPATQERLADVLGFTIRTRKAAPKRTGTVNLISETLGPLLPPWWKEPTYSVTPGYYPDPYDTDGVRWNDGTSWTYRVLVDGRQQSWSPEVPAALRELVAAALRYNDRTGQPLSAGRRWVETLEEKALEAAVSRDPRPEPLVVTWLVAWMDLAENSLWPAHFDTPYQLALKYFQSHRMRGAELSVLERYAAHFHVPLSCWPSGDVAAALHRRGHDADDVSSMFAVRGIAPDGNPETFEDEQSTLLDSYWTDVAAFLSSIGVLDITDTRSPGSAIHLASDDAMVHLQTGDVFDLRDVDQFIQQLPDSSHEFLAFCPGRASDDLRDLARSFGVGLFEFDPPGRPRPLNWEAAGFFDDHSDDDDLIDPDPDFFANN